ncbi:ABC transporter ATP-binding protein [uncultured Anaerococcus sp.]|mgnify:CR=1 FL=1|uniref:ABC transporter ATP-binding protein n=1 Tax=uncultured Anaerococcus sp. TaxID=293428 RepID=UPI0025D6EAC1|nr:ABC transporter ATP-binding protein [uncultured Anaerococcus sp.]
MKRILEVNDLTVAFKTVNGDKNAVNHISFDLYEKDFVGLVGESGCGKTVATQTILGIQSKDALIKSGSAKLRNIEVLGLSDKEWKKYRARNIATVFQEPGSALNPLMKVGEQIEEVLKIHYNFDNDKREDLVYRTMENVGLKDVENLYNKYPHQLSGGMQQRIVISIALIANPNVLIADEPTTALDAKVQSQIIDLFKDLGHIYNGAILFISHDLNLIERICKDVMIMYAGRLVEKGKTEDLVRNPLHPYTKALLKAVPNYKKRGEDLYNIRGHVPDLKNRSNEGCPFADRCDNTMDICTKVFPEIYDQDGHRVYCHLYGGKNG